MSQQFFLVRALVSQLEGRKDNPGSDSSGTMFAKKSQERSPEGKLIAIGWLWSPARKGPKASILQGKEYSIKTWPAILILNIAYDKILSENTGFIASKSIIA
jgi:hypothetical protein